MARKSDNKSLALMFSKVIVQNSSLLQVQFGFKRQITFKLFKNLWICAKLKSPVMHVAHAFINISLLLVICYNLCRYIYGIEALGNFSQHCLGILELLIVSAGIQEIHTCWLLPVMIVQFEYGVEMISSV